MAPFGDQVVRQEAYELAHPGTVITCGFDGMCSATVPGRETPVIRRDLRNLLDALDTLDGPTAPPGGEAR
jgi:hypothetical protein